MRPITKKELIDVLEAEHYDEMREDYVRRKRAAGFEIYCPEENELLLDIDTDDAFERFKLAFARLQKERDTVMKAKMCASQSGLPHRHIIVEFDDKLEPLERIALQAVMGSDLIREMLSIYRQWNGDPVPTLLAVRPNAVWETLDIKPSSLNRSPNYA